MYIYIYIYYCNATEVRQGVRGGRGNGDKELVKEKINIMNKTK